MSRVLPGTDLSIYEPDSLTGGRPVLKKQPNPNSIADKLDWAIDWDTPSGYTSTNEYVRPWDVEGWGSGDVVITPPRNPGGYVPPSRPGIQEGQRDYVFMPTEKEQWRTEDENKRRQALAVGKDWKEARLPRSVPEELKEKVYPDWRDDVGPGKKYPYGKPDPSHPPDVVHSRPVFPKEPREEDRRVYAGGGSPIRGVSGHDYLNDPKYRDHGEKRAYGKPVMPPKREKHPWGTEGDHDYAEKKEKWHRINKHPDGGHRFFPSDNESRKTRRPSLRDTLVGAMRRSWR
jgi:hypothetical protein